MGLMLTAFRKLTAKDALDDIAKAPNVVRLEEYVYNLMKHRAMWSLIDEAEFETVMEAYRSKYKAMMGREDYYRPTEKDIGMMIAIAWKELKKHKDNIQGARYAVNLALKYYPTNEYALRLKDTLDKSWHEAL